jgi:type IV secretion system protein VirD4
VPVTTANSSWSIHRQKVLHQGDIANLPPGRVLLFEGAAWRLVGLAMHWHDPVWQRRLVEFPTRYLLPESRKEMSR